MTDDLDEEAAPGIGHNSRAGGIAGDQLKSIVERVERVRDDIGELKDDEKEIFAEAKSSGFDVATIKRVLRKRAQRKEDRAAEEALTELYMHALGMI